MASILGGTHNTRVVATVRGHLLVRSDAPVTLTSRDIAWLLEHDMRTLIDLRSKPETDTHPVPLAGDKRFSYVSLPVVGGNAIPSTPEDVPDSYVFMAADPNQTTPLNRRMTDVIATIEGAKSGVMWFCSAGKDRTGVVTAIVLSRLGFSREDIVADYLLSAENLRPQLEEMARTRPHVRLDVITPQRTYIERFLDWYESHPHQK